MHRSPDIAVMQSDSGYILSTTQVSDYKRLWEVVKSNQTGSGHWLAHPKGRSNEDDAVSPDEQHGNVPLSGLERERERAREREERERDRRKGVKT